MNPSTSSSTFQRRRLSSRVKALRPLLLAVVTLAAVGFGAWAVFFSSWLAAEHVAVRGESTVAERDVEAAARVTMGTPLSRLDLDPIRDRVAALPAVRTVTVHRAWPNTVTIDITERQPVAAIHRGGAWWVLDDEGVIFRRTPRRETRLPVIAVGSRAGVEAVREAASVVVTLPRDLLSRTRRLAAASMDSITLRLKDDSVVIWGSAAESDRKVEVLEALLANVKASTYDLSVPEQPTTSG